jgi:hypothetical protein
MNEKLRNQKGNEGTSMLIEQTLFSYSRSDVFHGCYYIKKMLLVRHKGVLESAGGLIITH